MKLILLLSTLFSINLFADVKICGQSDLCFQSLAKDHPTYSEPIRYEQSKQEAISLLKDVLTTTGLTITKVESNRIKAQKTSLFLRVNTYFIFKFNQSNIINFTTYSDSPKLDTGKTKEYLQEIKFRFYQNNM